jgi:hypothetical protein
LRNCGKPLHETLVVGDRARLSAEIALTDDRVGGRHLTGAHYCPFKTATQPNSGRTSHSTNSFATTLTRYFAFSSILKVRNCDGQHRNIARLGKQMTFMLQRCHQIVNHDKCSYTPGGVHGSLLWTVV